MKRFKEEYLNEIVWEYLKLVKDYPPADIARMMFYLIDALDDFQERGVEEAP